MFVKKITFLLKNKASVNVLFSFIKHKILNILIKRKIIKFKRKHEEIIKSKKITNNFFSSHAYNFYNYLNQLNQNFDYLEIGSYEGNSSICVASLFPNSKIKCVDNWIGTDEYINHISFSKIEENFDYNVKEYENIYKIKTTSDLFFENNKSMFDAIYVDGYHYGPQVYADCKNAWKTLKKNGILICDDYIWDFYPNLKDSPCYAINRFLKELNGFYSIKKVSNSQIFITKNNC